MALTTKITCDVCGAEKKGEWRWWTVYVGNSLTIMPGIDHDSEHQKDICSTACMRNFVTAWMHRQLTTIEPKTDEKPPWHDLEEGQAVS